MNDIETMHIDIDLTPEEYNNLRYLAIGVDTTVNGLLSQFVADLMRSERARGLDECLFAGYWFDSFLKK